MRIRGQHIIFLLGMLFLMTTMCAQKQPSLDDEFGAGDDQFEADLLRLIDDESENPDSGIYTADEPVNSEDDVLALLTAEPEPVTENDPYNSSQDNQDEVDFEALLAEQQNPQDSFSDRQDDFAFLLEEEPQVQDANSDETVSQYQAPAFSENVSTTNATYDDINSLEMKLSTVSNQASELQQKVYEKEARIAQLEQEIDNVKTTPKPVQTASQPANHGYGFRGQYNNALNLFEQYNYQAVINSMSSLMTNFPNHRMVDNCQYWIGESYYGMKDYQKAIIEFQKVFAYSQVDKHDDAQFMIALAYRKIGNHDQSRAEFQKFLNTYPHSEYAPSAQKYLR